MSSTSSRKPAHESIEEILTHDCSKVAAVFADFQPVLPDEERGRFARTDIRPRADVKYHGGRTRLPGYGVRSSFTEKQGRYVAVCASALAKLAVGELLESEPSSSPLPSLSTNIQDRFLGQPDYHTGFVQALVISTTGLFGSFGSRYPNLAPALKAIYDSGAMTFGTVDALFAAKEALHFALSEGPDRASDGILGLQDTRKAFTALHPADNSGATHEVHCPFHKFAWVIFNEAEIAADALAASPGVRDSYNADSDIAMVEPVYEFMYEQVKTSIVQAYTVARTA